MASPCHWPLFRARVLLLAALAAGLPGTAICALAAQPATPAHRQPVLVELFTSEGCSDCPPADTLLAELDAKQFVPDAEAIVLSEHVTYWNRQGWVDPFSSEEFTFRQQEYETRFGLDSSYTPQMVVDGAAQFVGSNEAALESAVTRAAETSKQELAIENAHWEGGAVQFSVKSPADSGASLMAVLAANATQSEVARGENAGRTLHHVAVARAIKDFGSRATDGRPLKLSGGSLAHGKEASEPVRLVVFLTDHKTGHVVAVAEQTLTR